MYFGHILYIYIYYYSILYTKYTRSQLSVFLPTSWGKKNMVGMNLRRDHGIGQIEARHGLLETLYLIRGLEHSPKGTFK